MDRIEFYFSDVHAPKPAISNHRYAISLSLREFLAISSLPQFLRRNIDMVASYRVVLYLQPALLYLGSYEQRCTQLLKVLHKCCNTDVLGVLLIYPHSPSGAARPRESCVYISQTPRCRVTIY